jgi:hypothetical protein
MQSRRTYNGLTAVALCLTSFPATLSYVVCGDICMEENPFNALSGKIGIKQQSSFESVRSVYLRSNS